MKRLLCLLVACATPGHPEDDVDYAFARTADGALAVTLDAPGDPSGTTTLSFGDPWGGIDHPETGVRSVTIDGQPIAAVNGKWVAHTGKRIHVVYELAPTPEATKQGSEPFHRPVVSPHLVHLIGTTGVMRPEHLANAKHAVTFRWQIPGWTGVSSYGDGEVTHAVGTLDELRDAVFLASDRLDVRRVAIGKTVLEVAAVNDFGFTDAQLAAKAQQVVTAQRAFFREDGPPFFLITAIPLGPKGVQYGGTGLTNSFAIFVAPQFDDLASVTWLLGHELFHSWNGRVIQPDAPEELMYWFSEGFTNFYARRLLYRAGLVDLAGYVANLNEEVQEYWLSPVRDAPNQAIKDGFWKSHDLERLPYQRGDVLALVLDRQLPGGLDPLMKQLVAEGRAGKTVSIDKLFARIPRSLRPTVVDGTLPALPSTLLAPCLALGAKQVGKFELGFDLQASQAAKSITGLVPGSAAERAGLREGDAVQGWSIYFNKPEVPVEITTGGKHITYLPQGAPVEVPVFAVADASSCPKLL